MGGDDDVFMTCRENLETTTDDGLGESERTEDKGAANDWSWNKPLASGSGCRETLISYSNLLLARGNTVSQLSPSNKRCTICGISVL